MNYTVGSWTCLNVVIMIVKPQRNVFRFVNVYVYNCYHGYTHITSLYTTVSCMNHVLLIYQKYQFMYSLFLFVFKLYLVSYFPPLIDILTLCHWIKIEEVNVSLLTGCPSPCWNSKYNISIYYRLYDSMISIHWSMSFTS